MGGLWGGGQVGEEELPTCLPYDPNRGSENRVGVNSPKEIQGSLGRRKK